jgi:hypothetical protein
MKRCIDCVTAVWLSTVLGLGCKEQVAVPGLTIKGSQDAVWAAVVAADDAVVTEYPAKSLFGPNDLSHVTAPLAARIDSVQVQPGDQVVVGQVLAQLAIPELSRANASIVSTNQELGALQRMREQQLLLRDAGMGKASELAQVDADIAKLQGQKRDAAAVLVSAKGTPGRGQAVVGAGHLWALRADLAGTVLQVNAIRGSSCEANSLPLFVIGRGNANRIEARTITPPGDDVHYTFIFGQRRSTVHLVQSGPSPELDGSMRLWFEPTTMPSDVPPGVIGKITVAANTQPWQVPTESLSEQDNKTIIWRRRSNQSAAIAATVLTTTGGNSVVTAELQEKDEVSITPHLLAADGTGKAAP